jgi:hypothetical protein
VIVANFNDQYGTSFNDEDRIVRLIRDEIAPQVAQDQRDRNARANTPTPPGSNSMRPSIVRWLRRSWIRGNFTRSSSMIPYFTILRGCMWRD